MNRVDLLTAAFSDAHREDYQTPYGARMLTEAEALIKSRLEFYALEYTLQDVDRVAVLSPVYTLPARITYLRYALRSDGVPLDQVDETVASQWQGASRVAVYAIRPSTIIVAGTPGTGDAIQLQYFGMPAPLVNDTDTNTLLNDYPQLYKEAIMVFAFKRAQDLQTASAMFQSANALIDEINRKMKKLLGGARSSNPYNVTHRSSY